jgi:hypothetical protein
MILNQNTVIMKKLNLFTALLLYVFATSCDSSSDPEPPLVQDKCSQVSIQDLAMCFSFTGTANERINDDAAQVTGATLTTDRAGNADAAYLFDGNDDHIRISNPTYQLDGSFTISSWIFIDENTTINGIVRLLDTRNPSFNPNNSLNIYYKSFDGELIVAGIGISRFNLDLSQLDAGNWINLIFVHDANQTEEKVEAYTNGLQLDIKQDGFAGHTYNNEDIIIGARADLAEVFEGKIDDILVFDRAFEENELAQLLSL